MFNSCCYNIFRDCCPGSKQKQDVESTSQELSVIAHNSSIDYSVKEINMVVSETKIEVTNPNTELISQEISKITDESNSNTIITNISDSEVPKMDEITKFEKEIIIKKEEDDYYII